jgi:hypothetical protein
MPAKVIDNLADGAANADDRASRKSRLLKGPEEFREARVDWPKATKMTKTPGEIEANGNERVRDRPNSIFEEPRASESRAARTRGRGDSQAQGENEMKMKPLIGLVATLYDERVC